MNATVFYHTFHWLSSTFHTYYPAFSRLTHWDEFLDAFINGE
jgi:hypothetical protein